MDRATYLNAQARQYARHRAWAFGDGPGTQRDRIIVRVEDSAGLYAPALYSVDRARGPFGAKAAALERHCVVNNHQPNARRAIGVRFLLTLPNFGA